MGILKFILSLFNFSKYKWQFRIKKKASYDIYIVEYRKPRSFSWNILDEHTVYHWNMRYDVQEVVKNRYDSLAAAERAVEAVIKDRQKYSTPFVSVKEYT